MSHRWNLSRWMDQLGLKRQDQPEIIHGVQPVTILGDHSVFAAPIVPAMAWGGGVRAGVASAFGNLQLTSRSPGGIWIRQVWVAVTAADFMRFRVTASPSTQANVVSPTISNMGQSDVESTLRLGTTVAALPNTYPQIDVILGGSALIAEGAYVAPGVTFEIGIVTANNAAQFAVMWEEYPAQPVSA